MPDESSEDARLLPVEARSEPDDVPEPEDAPAPEDVPDPEDVPVPADVPPDAPVSVASFCAIVPDASPPDEPDEPDAVSSSAGASVTPI